MRYLASLFLAVMFAVGLAFAPVTAAAPVEQGWYYNWLWADQYQPVRARHSSYAWSYGLPVDYSAYRNYQAFTPYGYYARYGSPCTYVGWLVYGEYGC